ncbi:MAG TPA: hypothetical protein VK308_00920, partial [Pyrinomonadaceae bacterium]|nr:hypothetical protein [Pyrinomonadaceae bacterium]
MSKKTITKNFSFVIYTLSLCCIFSGCFAVSSTQTANEHRADRISSPDYKKPEIVGIIKAEEITESSGIVASKCQADVLWTHNDSGDGAFVFALDARGVKLGTWKIGNAKNVDWEDIAAIKNANGECFLYIGDIGDNGRKRKDLRIYTVKEPPVSAENKISSRKNPLLTESAEIIKFEYPDSRHDAETLMVHPQSGDIYVVTKHLRGAAGVYKLSKNYNPNKTNRLEKIVDFTVPSIPNGFLTGGDISNDGKRVIVCDYLGA